MRIAFVGAQGTGKTTLLNELHARHPQIPTISEVARTVMEKLGVQTPAQFRGNPKASVEFQLEILKAQIDFEERNSFFFSDRSVIDNWVYFDKFCSQYVSQKEALRVAKIVQEQADKYHMIFLLRPEFPIVADGVRSTNPVYQKEMDSRIVEALSKFSAQSKVVSLTGSVFERLNQITQSIGKYITKCEEVHGLGLGYAEFLRGIYGYKTASAHGVDF